MRTDSDLAQLALIRSGAGIGVCQAAIARRDDAIVRVLPKQFSVPLETWITMHEDLRNSPRCRVTFEALVRVCGAMSGSRSERRSGRHFADDNRCGVPKGTPQGHALAIFDR